MSDEHTLGDNHFDAIHDVCLDVHFPLHQRMAINEALSFWFEYLKPRRRSLGPAAPVPAGFRSRRAGKRQRRLWLIRELALHYEIAGGRPTHNGWNRDLGHFTGFGFFLEVVYGILPPHLAEGMTVESFVRDAEHLGFSNDPMFDYRGGCTARATYLLHTLTAWRRRA